MKLTMNEWLRAGGRLAFCLIGMAFGWMAYAQAVSTTTVQGTVYLANGQPGAGTLDVSWPAFTTANNQAVAAGHETVTIAPDGFMSVNLAPNLGATPAGLYYTAVYHMTNGTTNTEYWVVPATAQAALGQVRAQVMPAAQAVQAVSKAYVDQAISALSGSALSSTGGTMSGPLTLSGDPTQPLQAADKHYVDGTFAKAVPLAGGSMTGPLATPAVNGVQAPVAGSAQATLQAAMNSAGANGAVEIPPTYAGTDGFTNPNGVYVRDLRQTSSQQFERSVKEFGAVCDGATDDTNALQAAINYAQTHGVSLSIPQGKCKTHTLAWHGESIGGLGKQVSALVGFPGQDVLATAMDSTNLLSYTRLHDLTIYVDQSVDVSCSAAEGRALAGSCAVSRVLESNSIFSPGGNGQTGTTGTGAGWAVGNCAIAMPALTGAGGNGLRVAEIENLEIAVTGSDPMAQYGGARSTHTCGMYLGEWPQWSEFRNIDIRGLNTGIAIPALAGTMPAGLNADSNRWQNVTIQATHGFTAAAGSNNVLDNVVMMAGNSSATGEPPTGLVLDFAGSQQGWTVRNTVVLPTWNAVQPQLTVAAAGGAVTGVTVGPEHGLGFDPYGTQASLAFSGSCTAQAMASVNSNGSIGSVTVTQGGTGCSGTTTASVNVAGTWDTAAPVNLIGGQSMAFFGGNLLKGNGGYTVWKAAGSQSYGTQLDGGGGTLPGGGSYAALVTTNSLGSAFQVDQFPGADFGAKLQQCLGAVSPVYGGTCDARNFTGSQSMGSNLTISTANTTVLLPCATISTANQVVVTAGTRNVTLRGCGLRGASTASGSRGGTAFLYSGAGAMIQVGDPAYAMDTMGFHLDNVLINTTASMSGTTNGLAAYRTQEMDVESLYFLGNSNQTGMTLDGTGNYTGGTFFDDAFNGFQTAVNAIGHQVLNPATGDWVNASTFVRLHIDCPTSGGSPISGTYGINLQQGDGNTFTGGDVEGCNTVLHLGANAVNNTIVGLRNEVSNNQVVADAGSAYNNWMTGGTMFTGQLTDNGTRNSFLDTFHRSFNGMNGDWYGSQKDATITNHFRIGTGTGNERGLLSRYQTDYGYRWTMGLSDATAGEQFYQILDELNNVYRLSIGQYNNGQSSSNDQTVINAAGTGAVVVNGSNNSGTGGLVIGSGGPSETTVATINNAGNAQFVGTLQVGGVSTFLGSTTVKNQADAEIDATLWAGLTTSQKESFIYKDFNGNSQWYAEKDASNNWELNSAVGGLDSFKAYQSTNSGDTYINASNATGVVRVNYETGSGTAFNVYGGNSSTLYASFTGAAAIKFPGLAAGTGHNCVQVDSSGYLTNTGSACGTGTSSGSGTVGSANQGQIAYYTGNGTTIGGENTVPVAAGGTGAATASSALANLNGISSTQATPQTMAGPLNTSSDLATGHQAASANEAVTTFSVLAYGAVADFNGATGTDNTPAFNACSAAAGSAGGGICAVPTGRYFFSSVPTIGGVQQYVLIGGYDSGEYGTPQGGSGGALTCAPNGNGVLTSCTVASAGSGYIHSAAALQTTITGGCGSAGYSNGPCGWAWVTATTNSSGQISGGTVVYGGYGFTSTPTITVNPLGGDGAAATATLTGSTMNVPALTSGGSGYAASSTLNWYALVGGSGCATITTPNGGPNVAAYGTVPTNSSGVAAGTLTVTANATGCTAAPAIIFGDFGCNTGTSGSPVWGQCSNMAPTNPIKLPVQVMMTPGVSFVGETGTQGNGVQLYSNWSASSFNTNQWALFGGPLAYMDLRNLEFGNDFVGIWATNNVNYANLDGLSFSGGLGLYTYQTDVSSNFSNFNLAGIATWINGGTWASRVDYPQGKGGMFDATALTNIVSRPSPYQAGSSDLMDNWFAANIWHPEYSGASTDFYESCKFPQALNQRQTSHTLSAGNSGQQANSMCYPGISSLGLGVFTRDNRTTGAAIVNVLDSKQSSRGIFYGSWGAMQGTNVSCESCGYLSDGVTPFSSDPYRTSAILDGAVTITDNGSAAAGENGSMNGLSWAGTQVTSCLYSLSQASPHYPAGVAWNNLSCASPVNAEPAQNPQFTSTINFPGGLNLTYEGGNAAQLSFWNLVGNTPTNQGYWAPTTYGAQFYGNHNGGFNEALNLTSVGTSFYAWNGATVDVLDISASGVTANKPVSAPSVATTGSSTFGGSGNTFNNGAAVTNVVAIQAGSGAAQTAALGWNNFAGTAEWQWSLDTGNTLHLADKVNAMNRMDAYQNGNTNISAGNGANLVCINCVANSGTGGLLVQNGAASPSTVLTVTGSGNTTAAGFISGKFFMGTGTMGLTAGAAAGAGPTIACATNHVCSAWNGTVTLTTGTSPATGTLATLSFPNTHTNDADCQVSVQSSTGLVTTNTWSESTTALTITANAALAAGTAYTVKYICGGN